MRQQLIQLLWWHASHRAPMSGVLVKLARRYMLGWHNANVDIRVNGESWVIAEMAKRYGQAGDIYFDVGANRGEWSRTVLDEVPGARLYAFEPVPQTCRNLERELAGGAVVTQVALSDEAGTASIRYCERASDVASMETLADDGTGDVLEIDRLRGEQFCEANGIDRVFFLKVDTEGHDLKVLRGFGPLIDRGGVDIIQFEYNYMSIYSRTLLRDYFDLLGDSYRIGRLLPKRIEVFDYRFGDENFVQSNFIAVRRGLLAANGRLPRGVQ